MQEIKSIMEKVDHAHLGMIALESKLSFIVDYFNRLGAKTVPLDSVDGLRILIDEIHKSTDNLLNELGEASDLGFSLMEKNKRPAA